MPGKNSGGGPGGGAPRGQTQRHISFTKKRVFRPENQKLQKALEDQALTQGPNLETPPKVWAGRLWFGVYFSVSTR